jgi:hypothetical protein
LPSPASSEGSTFEPVFGGQTARLNEKKWFEDDSLVVVAHRMILADLIVPSPALCDNDEAALLSQDSRVASLLISGKSRWLSLPVRLVVVGV